VLNALLARLRSREELASKVVEAAKIVLHWSGRGDARDGPWKNLIAAIAAFDAG
jgi:hypothetical protein